MKVDEKNLFGALFKYIVQVRVCKTIMKEI